MLSSTSSFLWTSLIASTLSMVMYSIQSLSVMMLVLLSNTSPIRYFIITKPEYCRRIQRRVNRNCSQSLNNEVACGQAIGKWYIIFNMQFSYRSDDEPQITEIRMIATTCSFLKLISLEHCHNDVYTKKKRTIKTNSNTRNDDDDMGNEGGKITKLCTSIDHMNNKKFYYFEKQGSYSQSFFRSRLLETRPCTPSFLQQKVMDRIVHLYNKKNHVVVLLTGPTGTGKSFISILLAQHYDRSSYCNSLQLWQPGEFIGSLYHEVEPNRETPLIIVMDEIDIAFSKIEKGIPSHLHVRTQIQDKIGWNKWLDEFHWGFYPYTIIVMTTNRSMSELSKSLDRSFVRPGRIDIIDSSLTKSPCD